MKKDDLKKIFIKIGAVAVAAIAVTGGAYFASGYFEDEALMERNRKEGQTNGVIGENAMLKERIAKSSESYGLYEKILRFNKLGDFSLNRDVAAKLLNDFKTLYPIDNLQVSISPIQDLPGEMGAKKTGKVVLSEVKITFDSPTDTTAFNVIRAIYLQFPGLVNYQSIKFNKRGDITASTFQGIAPGKYPPLVSTEIVFNWLGIRTPEKPSTPVIPTP